jgi:hypothetical protein
VIEPYHPSASDGGLLHLVQRAPRLRDQHVADIVDRTDASHPFCRENNDVLAEDGERATRAAGSAAPRYDRHVGRTAQPHDIGYFGSARRPRDADHTASPANVVLVVQGWISSEAVRTPFSPSRARKSSAIISNPRIKPTSW